MGIIMSSLRCCILRASVQSTSHPVNYNTQTLGKYISSQVVLIIKHQNLLSQMARGPFSLQLLNVQCLVIVTEAMTRRGRREKRRGTTRRAVMPMFVGNGSPKRAPPTPPAMRMPPTSLSTKAFSSPTSATSASWQSTTKRRRYKLEPPPSILHLVMRVVLVRNKMTCLLFLPILTCNKRKH
jgi:hypothetical protein